MNLNFSSVTIKGYSALAEIEKAVEGMDIIEAPAVVLNALSGMHTIYCSSEWRHLCEKTFALCGYDSRRFMQGWQPILDYLKTKPRGFEPGSGMNLLEALADKWCWLNTER